MGTMNYALLPWHKPGRSPLSTRPWPSAQPFSCERMASLQSPFEEIIYGCSARAIWAHYVLYCETDGKNKINFSWTIFMWVLLEAKSFLKASIIVIQQEAEPSIVILCLLVYVSVCVCVSASRNSKQENIIKRKNWAHSWKLYWCQEISVLEV